MCKDFHLAFSDGDHNDVDGFQFHQEILITLIVLLDKVISLLEKPTSLTYLNFKKVADNFLNHSVALKIFLTVPLTVTTGEKHYPVLKLNKLHLRSTIPQERLVA
ncbi:hypothetical protein AVEN_199941-1 [Araneus ventricosus]|uniref:HAT C-terminal dimerisation domain-containing protein n=1 Tax=Araneus ventricosus TaxID=182803 RepID=A0A4Y2PXS6_ARAVE|nr:hypothetical protein AVEN_199941-1 [Araneus ventricosus]